MQFLADVPVAPGGPSAPAWAFFTGISLAVLGILAQQLKAWSDVKALREQTRMAQVDAAKAAKSASKAQANTEGISNGFASGVDRKLTRIIDDQAKLADAFRDHLEWHLDQKGGK